MKLDKKKELLKFGTFWLLGITILYFGFKMMFSIANFVIFISKTEILSNQVLFASLITVFIYSLLIYLAFKFARGYFKLATKKEEQD